MPQTTRKEANRPGFALFFTARFGSYLRTFHQKCKETSIRGFFGGWMAI
jgi:hypothetical protein